VSWCGRDASSAPTLVSRVFLRATRDAVSARDESQRRAVQSLRNLGGYLSSLARSVDCVALQWWLNGRYVGKRRKENRRVVGLQHPTHLGSGWL
jgi:hypothetical protein